MVERIHMAVDPQAENAGYNKMTTILRIRKPDGSVITGRADFGKGSPQIPMSYEEVAAKFQDCADFVKWPASKSKAIVEMVRTLETVPDVRKLAALCAA